MFVSSGILTFTSLVLYKYFIIKDIEYVEKYNLNLKEDIDNSGQTQKLKNVLQSVTGAH